MCAIPVQASLIGRALGHYQVEALIGRGAMGTVYLARDLRLNRLVALKVLLGSYAQSAKAVQQFHAEAHAAAPLRHENVVRIYMAGTEDNIPYIAMEFVDGEPLDRFLRRKGAMAWPAALYVAGQVAMALDCAHEHGVVHRDVKPSNIMLDRKGRVRLTDFGIARMQSEGAGQAGAGSRFVGTPQYMSPEQCMGRDVGPQSDLFSLGVCLYQMISGRMPFEGESSMALIKAICTEEPPRLNKLNPEIPDDVSRIVAYLMEKEPDMRPASARTAYALMRRTRKQVGGQTAVADSITAFLKEETEARPFSRVYEERQSGLKRRSTVRRRVAAIRLKPVLRAAAVAACALGAFAAPIVLAGRGAQMESGTRAPIGTASFANAGGDQLVDLHLPAYRVVSMDWTGTGTLILRNDGRPGGLAEGSWGLVLVDPAADRVYNYLSPDALARSPYSVLDAAHYDGGTLLAVEDRARGDVVVMRQRLEAAVPDSNVLLRIPRDRWTAPTHAEAGERHSGGIAVSRDGERLALLLWDPVANSFGVYVHSLAGDARQTLLETRTSRRGAIVPGSVRFSPDGSRIGYLRTNEAGYRDLWVLDVSSGQLDGELVALRVMGDAFSFSPDSALVAATTAGRDVSEHSVRVFALATRQTVLRVPEGRVSPSAWRGPSNTLVYARATSPGQESLRAANLDADGSSQPLRTAPIGSGASYALSEDGRWIAVSTRDGAAVRLLDWNDVNRRGRPATVE